jgi:hypothetical protein
VSGSSSKKLTIHVPPNCLIIHLKRFSGSEGDPRASPSAWEESQSECRKVLLSLQPSSSPPLSSPLLLAESSLRTTPQCASRCKTWTSSPLSLPVLRLSSLPSLRTELHPQQLPTILETAPSPALALEEATPLVKPKRGRKKKAPPPIKTEPDSSIAPPSPPPPALLYDLCGLVSHRGESLLQGHYVSYVRSERGWEARRRVHEEQTSDSPPPKKRKSVAAGEVAEGPQLRGRGRSKAEPIPVSSKSPSVPTPPAPALSQAWIRSTRQSDQPLSLRPFIPPSSLDSQV